MTVAAQTPQVVAEVAALVDAEDVAEAIDDTDSSADLFFYVNNSVYILLSRSGHG